MRLWVWLYLLASTGDAPAASHGAQKPLAESPSERIGIIIGASECRLRCLVGDVEGEEEEPAKVDVKGEWGMGGRCS